MGNVYEDWIDCIKFANKNTSFRVIPLERFEKPNVLSDYFKNKIFKHFLRYKFLSDAFLRYKCLPKKLLKQYQKIYY